MLNIKNRYEKIYRAKAIFMAQYNALLYHSYIQRRKKNRQSLHD